ncbi:MAG: cell division protein ZapA [Thermodesulfobacteriota bacterium]|nr:cell division protein ZapA [Thermodesulfobacteriota bacterium]
MGEHITIHLFGKSYTFEADADVPNAHAVADLLEQEVTVVAKRAGGTAISRNPFAMLTQAALNIANECVGLRSDRHRMVQVVTARSQALIQAMDARLH